MDLDYFDKQILSVIKLHKDTKRLLMGDKTLEDDTVEEIRRIVAKCGIHSIFKTVDELYPGYTRNRRRRGSMSLLSYPDELLKAEIWESQDKEMEVKVPAPNQLEFVDELQGELYNIFLRDAQSVIFGREIPDKERISVAHFASLNKVFFKHLVSPLDYGFVSYVDVGCKKLLEDLGYKEVIAKCSLVKDLLDDEDLLDEEDDLLEDDLLEDEEVDDCSLDFYRRRDDIIRKDAQSFGCTYEHSLKNDAIYLAKALWENHSIPTRQEWLRIPNPPSVTWERWGYYCALQIILDAKLKKLTDAPEVLSKIKEIAQQYKYYFKDCFAAKDLKVLIADLHIMCEQYDKALCIYEELLPEQKYYQFRPLIASHVIDIKRKIGIKIGAKDLMSLVQPSSYKMTFNSFYENMKMAEAYLDSLLDAIMKSEDVLGVLDSSGRITEMSRCFYRCFNMGNFLDERFNLTYPEIDPTNDSVKSVLDILFDELKFFARQVNDNKDVIKNWAEELSMYIKLRKKFPDEEIVFHYRTSWTWKFQIPIYFPRLNLGIAYIGDGMKRAESYTRQSGGMDEYLRLYKNTLQKATKKYGIMIEIFDTNTPESMVEDVVKSMAEDV